MCLCLWLCRAGKWQNIPFSAADFMGNGAMTWTVTAANIGTLAYTVIGKTMIIAFEINTTTVGGNVYTQLRMNLPGGAKAKRLMRNQIRLKEDNNPLRAANATVEPNNGQLIFALNDFTTNFIATTNGTTLNGEITFEIL